MRFTESLTENRDFTRLYRSGKCAAGPYVAVYCRKNRLKINRLGITASVKLGGAVVRNRIRRRIREAYRTHEHEFRSGFDLVIVARSRAANAPYRAIEQAIRKALYSLNVMKDET